MVRATIYSLSRIVYALVLGTTLFATYVHADSIDRVLKDLRQEGHQKQERSVHVLFGPKYFNLNSNYYKLFASPEGPQFMFEWMGFFTGDYTTDKESVLRSKEYAFAKKVFLGPKKQMLEIHIFVPHPKFEMMQKMGLIREIAQLEPPILDVSKTDEVEINGRPAKIYMITKGGCSLVMHLTKGTVLQIFARNKNDIAHLTKLAGMLNLDRLESKLNS